MLASTTSNARNVVLRSWPLTPALTTPRARTTTKRGDVARLIGPPIRLLAERDITSELFRACRENLLVDRLRRRRPCRGSDAGTPASTRAASAAARGCPGGAPCRRKRRGQRVVHKPVRRQWGDRGVRDGRESGAGVRFRAPVRPTPRDRTLRARGNG